MRDDGVRPFSPDRIFRLAMSATFCIAGHEVPFEVDESRLDNNLSEHRTHLWYHLQDSEEV